MDRKTLLIFAQRILNCGSEMKARISLQQLQNILEQQDAETSDINLVKKMLESIPEMRELAQKSVLTEKDIEIAERRARERKAREEAARYYSRC